MPTYARLPVLRDSWRRRQASRIVPYYMSLPSGLSSTSLARRQILSRSQTEPEFCEDVGKVSEQLRKDHHLLPFIAPGLTMALPTIRMELAQIPGTGRGGRLTKDDLLGYLKQRSAPASASAPVPAAPPVLPSARATSAAQIQTLPVFNQADPRFVGPACLVAQAC